MARLESIVQSDPEILGGTPVFRGTRVPVVRRSVSADDPPTDRFRQRRALDGPDRHVRSHMPCPPLPDPAMANALAAQILGHLRAPLLTPALFIEARLVHRLSG